MDGDEPNEKKIVIQEVDDLWSSRTEGILARQAAFFDVMPYFIVVSDEAPIFNNVRSEWYAQALTFFQRQGGRAELYESAPEFIRKLQKRYERDFLRLRAQASQATMLDVDPDDRPSESWMKRLKAYNRSPGSSALHLLSSEDWHKRTGAARLYDLATALVQLTTYDDTDLQPDILELWQEKVGKTPHRARTNFCLTRAFVLEVASILARDSNGDWGFKDPDDPDFQRAGDWLDTYAIIAPLLIAVRDTLGFNDSMLDGAPTVFSNDAPELFAEKLPVFVTRYQEVYTALTHPALFPFDRNGTFRAHKMYALDCPSPPDDTAGGFRLTEPLRTSRRYLKAVMEAVAEAKQRERH